MAFSFLRANRQVLQHLFPLNSTCPIFTKQLQRLCSTQPSLKLEASTPDKKDNVAAQSEVKAVDKLTKYDAVKEPLKQWTQKTLSGSISDPRSLHSDPELKSVCSYLENNVSYMSDYHLVNILRSLMVLKIDPNSHLVKSVENEILWKMRRMNLRMLLSHLDVHLQHQQTQLQKEMVRYLVEAIEKRVFELNPTTLFKVLSQVHLFSSVFIEKVEDKAMNLVEHMTTEQLVKLLTLLSQAKLRPTSLLSNISYYLTKHPCPMTAKNCFAVLFSLNALSFPHLELITKATQDLSVPDVLNTLTSAKMLSLLSLLGQLHFKDQNLLEHCCSKLLSSPSNLEYQQVCFIVNSLGSLRHVPDNFDVIPSVLRDRHASAAEKDFRWVNLVWNLAILGNLDFLPSIYQPGVCEALIQDAASQDPYKLRVIKLKLLNLNALALQQNPKGPDLSPLIGTVEVPHAALDAKLNEDVMACLHKFIPKTNYIHPNVTCPSLGVRIDAEFIVDSSHKPVPYSSYGLLPGKTSQDPGTKPLPLGYKRIALLTLSFRNYVLNYSEVLGMAQFVEQLLTGAGYTLVKVPFKEFDAQSSEVKKEEYLKKLIQNACLDEKKQ